MQLCGLESIIGNYVNLPKDIHDFLITLAPSSVILMVMSLKLSRWSLLTQAKMILSTKRQNFYKYLIIVHVKFHF